MSETFDYDLFVIGAGSGGVRAARISAGYGAKVAVDVGGRFFYEGRLPSTLYDHWMRSFADAARITLHVRRLRGRDRHHVVEAAFKALGLALRDALAEGGETLSTKGSVALEVS